MQNRRRKAGGFLLPVCRLMEGAPGSPAAGRCRNAGACAGTGGGRFLRFPASAGFRTAFRDRPRGGLTAKPNGNTDR